MVVLHEFHACDGVFLSFETACAVLDRHRHDICQQATTLMAARLKAARAMGWPAAGPPVVTAPLEREDERSATMAMQWIQADLSDAAEGGIAAWLNAHLRLLPRPTGGEPITELLLTTRRETTLPEENAFDGEFCVSFLRALAADLERRAALEGVAQR